jgi:hypothetical protein
MANILDLAEEAGLTIAVEPVYVVASGIRDEVIHWLETEKGAHRLWSAAQEMPASRKLIMAALDAGFRVPDDLVTLAAHRPAHGWSRLAEAERTELARRLSRAVDAASARWAAQQDRYPRIDRVVIWQSDATVYDVHARGRVWRVDAVTLLSPSRFAASYLQACQVAVDMPKPSSWRDAVNALLTGAETHDLSEDGNEAYFRACVHTTLQRLPTLDELSADVCRVASLAPHDEGYLFALHPLVSRIKSQMDASQPAIVAALVTLGASRYTTRIEGNLARLWLAPRTLIESR